MMGGLSPGLKRHSVSLFEGVLDFETTAGSCEMIAASCARHTCEHLHATSAEHGRSSASAGGRVTGADSIAGMIRELRHSVDAKLFEGEMTQLSEMARQVASF